MLESYISYFARQPIASIPVFLTIVPIGLLCYRKKYLDKTFLIFFSYLVIRFLTDLAMFDWACYQRNNMIFYNFSVPVRYAFYSWMFAQKIDDPVQNRLIKYSIPAFLTFSVWDIFYINPSISDLQHQEMVLFSTTVESLLMLFWILLYFFNTIRSLKIPNLLIYPFFWVCSGLLIYYSSALFIAPFMHYVSKWEGRLEIGYLYYVPQIFESVSILLFTIGAFQLNERTYAKQ